MEHSSKKENTVEIGDLVRHKDSTNHRHNLGEIVGVIYIVEFPGPEGVGTERVEVNEKEVVPTEYKDF